MRDHLPRLYPSHRRNLFRLNHAEFWILDMVEEYSEGIHWLVHDDYGNNKRYYRYTRTQLFDAFSRLARENWITGISGLPDRRKVQLTPKLIQREIERPFVRNDATRPERPDPPIVYYLLTSAGGRAWESFACPVWDHCIDGIFSEASEKPMVRGTATCSSKEHLEHYLRDITTAEIDLSTLRWKKRRPWKPRYWKTLPAGYEASFIMEVIDAPPQSNDKWLREHEFRKWYSKP